MTSSDKSLKTMMTAAAIVMSTLCFFSASRPALAYCSEPSAPSCASRYGAFDDDWEFDRCKREMETFKDEVENFIQCNNDEAQEAINKANSDNEDASSGYSDAVDSFNRRARSQ